jgi:microcompartment protein CcmK/EutM
VNLARVVGDVVATIKHEHLASQKLLLIQPVTPANEPTGRVAIAIDCAQAGPAISCSSSTRGTARRRC